MKNVIEITLDGGVLPVELDGKTYHISDNGKNPVITDKDGICAPLSVQYKLYTEVFGTSKKEFERIYTQTKKDRKRLERIKNTRIKAEAEYLI